MDRSEEIDFREEDIYWALDDFALQFDGYCAAHVIPNYDDIRERFFDDFKRYFYIPKDKLLVRTQLFMLQRYFGKWGGEQTPEYDRDYSLYYLLYLEVYRYSFNPVFKSDFGFHDHLPEDADCTVLENLAGAIRRHFSGEKRPILDSIDNIVDNYFSAETYGFLKDEKLLSRPEVILAASINPVLTADLFLRHSSEAHGSFCDELISMLKDLKLSQNDVKNHLFLYILQAWLSRNPSCVDTLSPEYVLLMFLYLHLYRTDLPEYLCREPFLAQWKKMSGSRKEDTAELFRKKLCIMREERVKKEYERYNKNDGI